MLININLCHSFKILNLVYFIITFYIFWCIHWRDFLILALFYKCCLKLLLWYNIRYLEISILVTKASMTWIRHNNMYIKGINIHHTLWFSLATVRLLVSCRGKCHYFGHGNTKGRSVDSKPDRRLFPSVGKQTTGTSVNQKASRPGGFKFQVMCVQPSAIATANLLMCFC